jgi:hypothetical protein
MRIRSPIEQPDAIKVQRCARRLFLRELARRRNETLRRIDRGEASRSPARPQTQGS